MRIGIGRPAAVPPTQIAVVTNELHNNASAQSKLRAQLMSLPLRFEPNQGQASDGSQYIADSATYQIHFSPDRAVLFLAGSPQQTLPIDLVAASANARIAPAVPFSGHSNYYLKANPSSWLTGVPNYAELRYEQIYPGIDLVFYGNRGRLEYDFVVAPWADPEAIAMRVPKDAAPTIAADGSLQLKAGDKTVEFLNPLVYQTGSSENREKSRIDAQYRLVADNNGTVVKFALGAYDRSRPLIIDPVLAFSEAAPSTQTLRGIQVDASGNIYFAGQNTSSGALQVTKLSSDGGTVLYTTSVANFYPDGFAVDSSGRAYVVGSASPGLATTSNAYQTTSSSYAPYFAALDAGGSITYASYFGGSSSDYAEGLTADSTGKAYIFGEACSTENISFAS